MHHRWYWWQKALKKFPFLKCEAISKKLLLKKNPIFRAYTSKILVAYYTMGIITFVTFP